jgi:ABC-type transport system involved in cytochrome bd biosynthesis fused ATPase/permease subunit
LNENVLDYFRIVTKGVVSDQDIRDIVDSWQIFESTEPLETIVHDAKAKLISEGQKKKLLIAKLMLLYQFYNVILIDEIDSNFDRTSQEQFYKELHTISSSKEDKIVIYISHSEASKKYIPNVLIVPIDHAVEEGDVKNNQSDGVSKQA